MSDFTEFSGNILESDDSRFLSFDILNMANGGEDIEVEIEKVIRAEAGSKFENGQPMNADVPIVVFKGEGVVTRRMWYVQAKTNRRRLGNLLGPIIDKWAGRKITLYPDANVGFAGRKGGIRIR